MKSRVYYAKINFKLPLTVCFLFFFLSSHESHQILNFEENYTQTSVKKKTKTQKTKRYSNGPLVINGRQRVVCCLLIINQKIRVCATMLVKCVSSVLVHMINRFQIVVDIQGDWTRQFYNN